MYSGRRLSFVDSISALISHPSTPTLVLYASDHSNGVVLAGHDIWSKTSFMSRLSFSTSASTPVSMNVLCYRSWDRLLTMIVASFGAYEKYEHFFIKNA